MPLGTLEVLISANLSRFNSAMDKAAAQSRAKARQLEKSFKGVSRLGNTLATSLSLRSAAIGGGILKIAGDFEAGMNQVRAVSNASAQDMKLLRDQAKQLGRETQFSASEAAKGMNFLAMSGNDAQQILSAMPHTLNLAAAANLGLGESADIVTNILAGYQMETDDLGHATDVLVEAFTNANTDLSQLGEAMKFAGPVAKGFGLSFEEAVAAVSLMGNAGIQASMAGTSLRNILTRLQSEADDLGITFFDSTGKMRPLVDIMRDIEANGADMGTIMEELGQRGGPALQALLSQGTGEMERFTEQLRNVGEGRAADVAKTQMEGFNGAMKGLSSALEGLAIAIADSGLIDFATEMVSKFTGFVRTLSATNPQILETGTVIAGLATVTGPVLIGFAGLAKVVTGSLGTVVSVVKGGTAVASVALKGFALLLSPAGLVVGAIAGLAAAAFVYRDEIAEAFTKMVEWIQDAFNRLTQWLSQTKEKVIGFARDTVNGVKEWFGSKLESATEAASDAAQSVADAFEGLLDDVVGNSFVPDMVEGIAEWFGKLDTVMVDAAVTATQDVSDAFGNMADTVGGYISDLIKGTKDLGDVLADIGDSLVDKIVDIGVDLVFSGRTGGNGGGIVDFASNQAISAGFKKAFGIESGSSFGGGLAGAGEAVSAFSESLANGATAVEAFSAAKSTAAAGEGVKVIALGEQTGAIAGEALAAEGVGGGFTSSGAGGGAGSGAGAGAGIAAAAVAAIAILGLNSIKTPGKREAILNEAAQFSADDQFQFAQFSGAITSIGSGERSALFRGGPEGFVTDFARSQGIEGLTVPDQNGDPISRILGLDQKAFLDFLSQAEEAFNSLAESAAKAFADSGVSAEQFKEILSDGVVTAAEQAQFGIASFGDMTVEQFRRVVDTGEVSYETLFQQAEQAFGGMTDQAEQFATNFQDGILTAAEAAQIGIELFSDVTTEEFAKMLQASELTGQSIREIAREWNTLASLPDVTLESTQVHTTVVQQVPANDSAPGFAQGGQFVVGGRAGIDSNLVQFFASPDEVVTIETPEQRAAGASNSRAIVEAIESMHATIARQQKQIDRMIAATHLAA